MCVNSVHFCHLVYSMFSQKFIFIFIFEYPLRIISELIKILVDTLIIYYTDFHDVDEEMVSIAKRGGYWSYYESGEGITHWHLADSPSSALNTVASSNTGIDHLSYG